MWTAVQSHLVPVANFVGGDVRLSSFIIVQLSSAFVFMFLSAITTFEGVYKSNLECVLDVEKYQAAVNSYCYTQGLFILEEHNFNGEKFYEPAKLSYYMWVPYAMLGCFISAFLGRFIYKNLMWGDLLPIFLNGIKEAMKIDKNLKREEVIVYLKKLITKQRIKADSKRWMYSMITLEFVSSITPFLQIYFLDKLLQGNFHLLGLNFENSDYLNTVFPKVAKCDFHISGPSGTIVNIDALCVLTHNPVNEKIFLCASCWLMFLAAVSITGLMWRVSTMIFFQARFFNEFVWTSNGVSGSKQCMQLITLILGQVTTFSEWIYLYYITRNLDFMMLTHFLDNLTISYLKTDKLLTKKLELPTNSREQQKGVPGGQNRDSRRNNSDVRLHKITTIQNGSDIITPRNINSTRALAQKRSPRNYKPFRITFNEQGILAQAVSSMPINGDSKNSQVLTIVETGGNKTLLRAREKKTKRRAPPVPVSEKMMLKARYSNSSSDTSDDSITETACPDATYKPLLKKF